jgi:hypothetical protein
MQHVSRAESTIFPLQKLTFLYILISLSPPFHSASFDPHPYETFSLMSHCPLLPSRPIPTASASAAGAITCRGCSVLILHRSPPTHLHFAPSTMLWLTLDCRVRPGASVIPHCSPLICLHGGAPHSVLEPDPPARFLFIAERCEVELIELEVLRMVRSGGCHLHVIFECSHSCHVFVCKTIRGSF